MLAYLEATFQIPFIFVILCYALGTAVFIGTGAWCRSIALGRYHGQALWLGIGGWMVRSWIWVIAFSLSIQIGLWPEYKPQEPTYAAELIALGGGLALFIGIHLKNERKGCLSRALKCEVLKHLQFFWLSLVIWALTISIFFIVNALSYWLMMYLPFLQKALDPSRDSAMIIGVLWLLPFIHWYQKAKILERWEGEDKTPKHYKFSTLLWPVVVGLFFFIMPLFAQKLVTSEKFQEMLDAKPPLERV